MSFTVVLYQGASIFIPTQSSRDSAWTSYLALTFIISIED